MEQIIKVNTENQTVEVKRRITLVWARLQWVLKNGKTQQYLTKKHSISASSQFLHTLAKLTEATMDEIVKT